MNYLKLFKTKVLSYVSIYDKNMDIVTEEEINQIMFEVDIRKYGNETKEYNYIYSNLQKMTFSNIKVLVDIYKESFLHKDFNIDKSDNLKYHLSMNDKYKIELIDCLLCNNDLQNKLIEKYNHLDNILRKQFIKDMVIEQNMFILDMIEDYDLQNNIGFIKELIKINPYSIGFCSAEIFNNQLLDLYKINSDIFFYIESDEAKEFLIDNSSAFKKIYLMNCMRRIAKEFKNV